MSARRAISTSVLSALVALAACSPYKGKTTHTAAEWTAQLEQAIAPRQMMLKHCIRYLPAELERAEVTVSLREDEDAHSEHELRLRAHNAGVRALDTCTRDALDVLLLPNTDDSHHVGAQWTVVYDRKAPFVVQPNQTQPLALGAAPAAESAAAAPAADEANGSDEHSAAPASQAKP